MSPSNPSSCPCPSILSSKSPGSDNNKKSHVTDFSSVAAKNTAISPLQCNDILKSKSPSSTTGEADKLVVEKTCNVVENNKEGKMHAKDTIKSVNNGSNLNKANNKDAIKKVLTSNGSKTNNKKDIDNMSSRKVGENKNMYEEARCQLKPTFDRQSSFNRKLSGGNGQQIAENSVYDNEESPIERLIRQDSIDASKTKAPLNPKKEAKKRDFLILNYPADVRKNLKSLSSFSFESDDTVEPQAINIAKSTKTIPPVVHNNILKEDDHHRSCVKQNEQKAMHIKKKRSLSKGRWVIVFLIPFSFL